MAALTTVSQWENTNPLRCESLYLQLAQHRHRCVRNTAQVHLPVQELVQEHLPAQVHLPVQEQLLVRMQPLASLVPARMTSWVL